MSHYGTFNSHPTDGHFVLRLVKLRPEIDITRPKTVYVTKFFGLSVAWVIAGKVSKTTCQLLFFNAACTSELTFARHSNHPPISSHSFNLKGWNWAPWVKTTFTENVSPIRAVFYEKWQNMFWKIQKKKTEKVYVLDQNEQTRKNSHYS